MSAPGFCICGRLLDDGHSHDELAKDYGVGGVQDAARQADEMTASIKKMAAKLVAGGVARLALTQEQEALEVAIETLSFIAKMTITVDGEDRVEPISRMEAKVGLAKIERALGRQATPPSGTPAGTDPAPPRP